MNQNLQTQQPQNTVVGLTNLNGFELAQRAAKLLSSSTLVPQEYRGQTGMANCVIALNMANRMGADPLMVMQNLVIVHGRPTWSSQFLIATFNSCGRFSSLRYEFFGEKGTDNWGCRAVATELLTGEKLVGTDVTIGIAKAEGWYNRNGSKWKTMPQQMLMYRAASWFIRANAPELSMGLHTQEEVLDAEYRVVDNKKTTQNTGLSIDDLLSQAKESEIIEEAEFSEAEKPETPVDTETGEILEPVTLQYTSTKELKSMIEAAESNNQLVALWETVPDDVKPKFQEQFNVRQDLLRFG